MQRKENRKKLNKIKIYEGIQSQTRTKYFLPRKNVPLNYFRISRNSVCGMQRNLIHLLLYFYSTPTG